MAEFIGRYPYQAPIDAYGDGGFRFADMSHRGSLLCLPDGMHAWPVKTLSELRPESLEQVLAQADALEVFFIGLGEDIAPFPNDLRDLFRERGIIVEAVSTGSAIRTYNIMLGESRAVGAALIAVERTRRAGL